MIFSSIIRPKLNFGSEIWVDLDKFVMEVNMLQMISVMSRQDLSKKKKYQLRWVRHVL